MYWLSTLGYKCWLHLERIEELVIQNLSAKLDWMDSRCREKLVQVEQKISWSQVNEKSSGCQER